MANAIDAGSNPLSRFALLIRRGKCALCRTIFTVTTVAVITFSFSLATRADPSSDEMAFTYKEDKFPGMEFRFIYAAGLFTKGTADRFRQFVKEKGIKDGAVVILDSAGGSVAEALKMGRIVREMHFHTEVSKQCFSSCTIAFLGGVRRTIGADGKFGVHRVSSAMPLEPSEALDMGQIAIAQIAEYAAFMGAAPAFVSELTRAGPNEINILSHDQLLRYRVISAPFTTKWEIRILEGHVYLIGETETNNGLHKMIFVCDQKGGLDIMMLYNAVGEYREAALRWTSAYRPDVDGKELQLSQSEIKRTVHPSGPEYLAAVVHVNDRIYNALASARVLGFMMLPPSGAIYAGWHSDFASGRAKYAEYTRTCRSR